MNAAILFPSSFPFGRLNSPDSIPQSLPPTSFVSFNKEVVTLGFLLNRALPHYSVTSTPPSGELNKACGFLIGMSGRLARTQKAFQKLADESLGPTTESHSWQMKGGCTSAHSKAHTWERCPGKGPDSRASPTLAGRDKL